MTAYRAQCTVSVTECDLRASGLRVPIFQGQGMATLEARDSGEENQVGCGGPHSGVL